MNSTFISTAELLENDHSGLAYKSLKEDMFNMTAKIKRIMDSGLDAKQANIAKRLLEATQTADYMLDVLYETYNK